MKPKFLYRSTSATDTGLRKTINEDSFLDAPHTLTSPDTLHRLGSLFAVADGVSGQEGGEIASKIAIDTLRMYYVLPHVTIPPEDRLRNVFFEAHRRIEEYAEQHPQYKGMGTTLTSVILKENIAYYGHVGDSRLYMIRPQTREISQLTEDHTLVNRFVKEKKLTPEEAAQEDSNVLDQALGCVAKIHVDVGEYASLRAGDLLLLCSDGLTDLVTDVKIRDIVLSSPSLADACHRLVMRANQQGGKDNITVVLIGIEETESEES